VYFFVLRSARTLRRWGAPLRGEKARRFEEGNSVIKHVMVRLDGSAADEARLAAAESICKAFEGYITGLFLNVLPLIMPPEGDTVAAVESVKIVERARAAGDRTEAILAQRLSGLPNRAEIRRFDVFFDTVAAIAAREARAADAFVALRPNGAQREPENFVEGVLFGGRHLLLVTDGDAAQAPFERVFLVWNGTRECARAMSEAMPYMHLAKEVSVVSVVEGETEENAGLGSEAVTHLKHHCIEAALHHPRKRDNDVAATLIAQARRLNADLIVMGGYGHSRLREWLLGGVTYELLHQATVPLLIAH